MEAISYLGSKEVVNGPPGCLESLGEESPHAASKNRETKDVEFYCSSSDLFIYHFNAFISILSLRNLTEPMKLREGAQLETPKSSQRAMQRI